MKFLRFFAIFCIFISCNMNAYAEGTYRELITLIDGSQIMGYISKDDLTSGTLEITADWTITSVPTKDVIVNREVSRVYSVDNETIEWLKDNIGEVPTMLSFANITMTGVYCNPDYLLYDQVLSSDSQTCDKILLEDGDILKYVDFIPRRFSLKWTDIARIDRIFSEDDYIVETIVPVDGEPKDGIIESQILRHHRVLKTKTGERFTYEPKSISSILKKTNDSSISLLQHSPILDCLELEDDFGGEKIEGVIIENNRLNKYFIILAKSEDGTNSDGGVSKKVKYADVKAIHYRRNK